MTVTKSFTGIAVPKTVITSASGKSSATVYKCGDLEIILNEGLLDNALAAKKLPVIDAIKAVVMDNQVTITYEERKAGDKYIDGAGIEQTLKRDSLAATGISFARPHSSEIDLGMAELELKFAEKGLGQRQVRPLAERRVVSFVDSAEVATPETAPKGAKLSETAKETVA